jgi:hypothetical protein
MASSNLFVGRVQLIERPVHGLFEQHKPDKFLGFFTNPSRLWGKFFAPTTSISPVAMYPLARLVFS